MLSIRFRFELNLFFSPCFDPVQAGKAATISLSHQLACEFARRLPTDQIVRVNTIAPGVRLCFPDPTFASICLERSSLS
jgi:NAD(P)-dependent dehydrogenase (short-subunit alcohol dehydrogenase family)